MQALKLVILSVRGFSPQEIIQLSLFNVTSPTIVNYTTSETATQSFYDFCCQSGLTQLVLSSTRGNNILDIILALADSNFLSNANINMPVCQSDHSLVSFNINCLPCTNMLIRNTQTFIFFKCNIPLANNILASKDWHALFTNCMSMDDYWFIFKHECLNIISQTTPLSCNIIRERSIPRFLWRAVLKKRRLCHRYNIAWSPACLTAFKSQSRLISLLFRQYRSKRNLRISQTHNTAQFWSYFSHNMSKQTESFPIPMVHGNKAFNDIKELPAAFNSFFMSVFCSNSPNSVSPYSLSAYAPFISSIYLTPNDVLTALLNLKPKYNSPDGIPAFFLKTFAAFLVSPLTITFNYSCSLHHNPKIGDMPQLTQ